MTICRTTLGAVLAASIAGGASVLTAAETSGQRNGLKPPSSFGDIKDEHARSIALFQEAGKVITSPRCLNCHPAGDSPTQTDTMRTHQPRVVRGTDGHGAAGIRCQNCHHDENSDATGLPGNPDWRLAPAPMAWQGKSLGEICALIKDPGRNGDRDVTAIVSHVSEDSLVGWAWAPGGGRAPAPGTQAEFGALMKAWTESGAECPQ
jgi:hypothetical protein